MATTVLMNLKEAAGLLQYRMGELVPELANIYDAVPFMETVLEDVFLGRPMNPDLDAVDILMLEGLDRHTASSLMHEVSNSIVDTVTNTMPSLNGAYTGYHFKVHDSFDLEVTIPDRSMRQPAHDHQEQAAFEYIEELVEDADNGAYIPEKLRRLTGC